MASTDTPEKPKLSYRTRKRLSLLILVVGIPLYIVVAVNVVALFDRPSILLELFIYVVLGLVWALPLRQVFLGVGKGDPDAPPGSPDAER